MRLDKFLQVSRIIKRRALANELCDQGLVSVNGQRAKAARKVKPGDLITIDFGTKGKLTVQVIRVPEGRVSKDEGAELYRIISDSRPRPPQA
ncbi:RNA-binding S4 domain-containing protein [Candidatus Poribacteria bacterium]|nr:MAG: RNA-binding S4 domain-containing protein [Candidatus Poribacteria bacterium]